MKVSVTVTLLLFFVAAILIGIHIFVEEARVILPFATAVLAGSVAAYAAYYARQNVVNNQITSRQKRSFEILDRLNSPDLARIRRQLNSEIDHNGQSPAELYKRIMNDNELLAKVTLLLGLYEDASIAAQCGYADEDVLYKSLAYPVIWTWDKFSGFVTQLRTEKSRQSLYCEVENLARAWKAEHSVSDKTRKLSLRF